MKLIVGNLKMNLTINQLEDYLKELEEIKDKIVICPTSIYAPYFIANNFQVGLQNVFYEDKGSYTGEISPLQAQKINIKYTILGHSERRIIFKESDEVINKKIKAALRNNLKVILCLGEKKNQNAFKIISEQLNSCLKDVSDLSNIIIAYEPVWAIGTNKTPKNEKINDVILYIKRLIKKEFNFDIKVLYGGSVNEQNIDKLNEIKSIDGFLIGSAAIDPKKLKKIVEVS